MAVSANKIYEFGEWRLDPAEHLVSRSGSPVPLGPKVFDTLLVLVENAGRSVRKIQGSDGFWAPHWSPDGRYISTRSNDLLTLMLYDFSSQTWSRIVDNTYVGDVKWSSDGRYLYYYYSRRGSDPAILRLRLLDGARLSKLPLSLECDKPVSAARFGLASRRCCSSHNRRATPGGGNQFPCAGSCTR